MVLTFAQNFATLALPTAGRAGCALFHFAKRRKNTNANTNGTWAIDEDFGGNVELTAAA